MNARERFLAIMDFMRPDRDMLWEFGYWGATLHRWYDEGLPTSLSEGEKCKLTSQPGILGEGIMWDPGQGARDNDVHVHFGMDEGLMRVPLNSYVSPLFDKVILDERGDDLIMQDPRGHIVAIKKDNSAMPSTIRSLVETREDWERVKAERLQPAMEGRLPDDWEAQKAKLNNRTAPLALGGIGPAAGLFHTSRYLMGVEKLCTSFYDEPELIREIMNYLANFRAAIFDKVLSEITVDCAYWTEDMAYNAGPFISPEMFREFLLPGYKIMLDVLHSHGVNHILVDNDGDSWKLIDCFTEAGVTGLGPMEVAANMDITAVREAYPQLQILGGIDKRELAKGFREIDAVLEQKVFPMFEQGGYIAHIDHQTPPDISFENFGYYRKRLADYILK